MSNTLPEGYQPSLLGLTGAEDVAEFVDRLFDSRAAAGKVYSDGAGFLASHLGDDWKERKTSDGTKRELARASVKNAELCADVIFTAIANGGRVCS